MALLADDALDSDLYARYMRSAGLRVVTAKDGVEALEQAFILLPDVIVLDMSMPRLNGDAVARLLKSAARTNHIPIALIAAYGL